MNREEVLNTFLLANIPEIITQEEFNDVKKAIKHLLQENKQYKEVIDKIKEYITIYRSYENINGKDYLKGRDEIGTLSLSQVDKLLDILKEVE